MLEPLEDPGRPAPGGPGIAPTWTSSAKDMVGCSLGSSRIWFTLGFGIVNEVYYPRVDSPQIRDLGFIVGDGRGFWVEVKRLQNYTLRLLAPGTPAVEIVHTHERFTLTLLVTPDPDRDVLVMQVELAGDAELRPYVLLAPRLGATGHDNVARIRRQGTRTLLTAEQGPFALALASVGMDQQDAFGAVAAGYVGETDGWQDFDRNGGLSWGYTSAGPGNVALVGALPRSTMLGLGFGDTVQAAATLAISSLAQPIDDLLAQQIQGWRQWHERRNKRAALPVDALTELAEPFLLSSMVLRSHRDKTYPGTMVASLSIPWGNSGDDRGGYHLVWPRDLVQCATGLLALGAEHEARDTLRYLIATQKPDGSWYQNQWLGGTSYWQGMQLDETAFPILLAAALGERDALHEINVQDMVSRALAYMASTGPSSTQDRWEENAGISTFTLAVVIVAFVAGADFLPEPAKTFALALADFFNANIESWTSVEGTPLAEKVGVRGYYVRIAPADVLHDASVLRSAIDLKNLGGSLSVDEEVSIDFLQLVRFGLRGADDDRIRDSVKVVDSLLKTDTPLGPVWHRYNGDGYGEHDDGSPFNGSGRGRGWPLLTGERGHYELMAGNDPMPYLRAMAAMTGPYGMMPEQVWDAEPLPAMRLFPGKPAGSAMPLAWAHAEFIKLMVSRHLGYPFDRPAAAWRRYGGRRANARRAVWRLQAPIGRIARGSALLIAVPRAARVVWSVDGWRSIAEAVTSDTGLGLQAFEVEPSMLTGAAAVDFTFRWSDTGDWIGSNFRVALDE